jgi:glycosyltransferase involved in cell wall biosynthesis
MENTKNSLRLEDLPPPPKGKISWPWIEPTNFARESVPANEKFPLISVLIPSYNYGKFIEETIRSILLQKYPKIELIVIDGGSTDNTIDVIRKYANYITYWVSETDQGQTDAINKGYQYCTGDIFVWLNADDFYYSPLIFETIANFYLKGYEFIAGECFNIDVNGNYRFESISADGKSSPTTFHRYLRYWSSSFLQQPAVFVTKKLADSCFPLDIDLYYAMDYQFFLRILVQDPQSIWIKEKLVKFRWHKDSKTMGDNSTSEIQYLEHVPEVYKVAMAESKSLLTWWQYSLFELQLRDYLHLERLIHQQLFPDPCQVLTQLWSRPTIITWALFWKIYLKSVFGKEFYSLLRKFAGK